MTRKIFIVPALIAIPVLACGLLIWGDQLLALIPAPVVDLLFSLSLYAAQAILLLLTGVLPGLLLALDRGGSMINTTRVFVFLLAIMILGGFVISSLLFNVAAVLAGIYAGLILSRRFPSEHWLRKRFSQQSSEEKQSIEQYKRQLKYLEEERRNLKSKLNIELANRFVDELPDEMSAAEVLLAKARAVLKAERSRLADELRLEGDERLAQDYLEQWKQHMHYAENACQYAHRNFKTGQFVAKKAIKCFEDGGKESTVVSLSYMARAEFSDMELNLQDVVPFARRFQ